MDKFCMNSEEAAEYIGTGVNHLRELARKGEIPAARSGKNLKFYKPLLEEYALKKAKSGEQL